MGCWLEVGGWLAADFVTDECGWVVGGRWEVGWQRIL
jgi:hypothetical protein